MEMSHLTYKLRVLEFKLFEDLLVHLIIISLPTWFDQFKVSYCQKETWSLNELISHCVQEEGMLKKDEVESNHQLLPLRARTKAKKKKNKDKEAIDTAKKPSDPEGTNCFFYGAKGHKKKHCTNYPAWCAKKLMRLNLVCSEVNLISIPRHNWWIDFTSVNLSKVA